MKKIGIVLSVLFLVGLVSMSYAQEKKVLPGQAKMFEGSITKLSPGDPEKRIPPSLRAAGPDEKVVIFEVKGADIKDKEGKPITFKDLKEGDRVEIKYMTNKAGMNIVKHIKVL